MNKMLLAATACAGMITAGVGYYVSPTAGNSLDIPPILVDGTPDQVMDKIHGLNIKQFISQVTPDESKSAHWSSSHKIETNGDDTITIALSGEKVLEIHAKAHAVAGGKTELDLSSELQDTRLARNNNLHPYDIKVMAAYANLLATDYFSSVLKRERMGDSSAWQKSFVQLTGIDINSDKALQHRLETALKESFPGEQAQRAAELGGLDPSDLANPAEHAAAAAAAAGEAAAGAAAAADQAASRAAADAEAARAASAPDPTN